MQKSALLKEWLPLSAIFIVALGPIDVLTTQSWHDQQRLLQILLISLASLLLPPLLLLRTNPVPTSPRLQLALSALVLLGLASSLCAHHPHWALTELALFCGSISLIFATRHFITIHGPVYLPLLAALYFVVLSVIIRFMASYAAALIAEAPLYADALLDGFANLRHLGQFQSLSLPLLAFPLLLKTARLSKTAKAAFFLLLSLWWACTFIGGTRACLLAVATTATILLFMGPLARQWLSIQTMGLLSGWGLHALLMETLPALNGSTAPALNTIARTEPLSGRGELWMYALQKTLEHPWLGIGPMHYADQTVLQVNHPHQSILQWACEWGLPSLAIGLIVLIGAAFKTLSRVNKNRGNTPANALRVCLTASLISAAAHSMVDGVLVMPYTMTWLAILAGWLWAISPGEPQAAAPSVFFRRLLPTVGIACALASSASLLYVAHRDYRALEHMNSPEAQPRSGKGADGPRFWLRGGIA